MQGVEVGDGLLLRVDELGGGEGDENIEVAPMVRGGDRVGADSRG